MNYLTYDFSATEFEGTPRIQTLRAQVNMNLTPADETEEESSIEIWIDYPCENGEWAGKPEMDSFSKRTAISLRDFLIFCFPPK